MLVLEVDQKDERDAGAGNSYGSAPSTYIDLN